MPKMLSELMQEGSVREYCFGTWLTDEGIQCPVGAHNWDNLSGDHGQFDRLAIIEAQKSQGIITRKDAIRFIQQCEDEGYFDPTHTKQEK